MAEKCCDRTMKSHTFELCKNDDYIEREITVYICSNRKKCTHKRMFKKYKGNDGNPFTRWMYHKRFVEAEFKELKKDIIRRIKKEKTGTGSNSPCWKHMFFTGKKQIQVYLENGRKTQDRLSLQIC